MTALARTSDGVSIAYDVTGAGPAIVFVHGLGDDRTLWQPLASRMAGAFTCVALDLRGHGESAAGPGVDFDPFGLHRDIEAVVAALGLRAPALVGHSLGGFAVTAFAAFATRADARAVVNVDQPMDLRPLAAVVRGMLGALEGPIEEVLLDILAAIGLGALGPQVQARLRATRARVKREAVLGLWRPLLEDADAALEEATTSMLRAVTAPYLSIHGGEIPDGYASWLGDRAATSSVEVWPGAGHFLHLTDPDRFVDRIVRFLR